MTTFDLLNAAWKAVESEANKLPGIYERRIPSQTWLALFAGMSLPSTSIRLALSVDSLISTEGLERETKGYKVHRQFNPKEKRTSVCLELNKATFKELFKVVAADVAHSVLDANSEAGAISAMHGRLDHWQKFMQTTGPEGLDKEDQIGLFGELTFLETMLQAGFPAVDVLGAWKGPSSANQDFQANGHAVEVKTTTRNSPNRVRISNELQLDESTFDSLALFHLWLGEQVGSGLSLARLVDRIRASLSESGANDFVDLLIQAGYHDVHKTIYDEFTYVERDRKYFNVDGEFPRVRGSELRSGVEEVAYSIDLAGLDSFRQSQTDVIRRLMVSTND